MSSTTVTIAQQPADVIVVGEGLRPPGHRLGFSFQFTGDDGQGKNTGTSAVVKADGTCKVVSDTIELSSMDGKQNAGTVKWWWHDGEDYDEPALTEEGGSGEFRIE